MSEIEIGSVWIGQKGVIEVNCLKILENRHMRVGYRYVNTGEVNVICKSDFLVMFKLKDDSQKPKHSHYHKDVSQYDTIDVYAVCKIFDVQDTSGCLQHAIKKLLVTGQRGHKDRKTDIQNAIDTLNRLLELEHGKDK